MPGGPIADVPQMNDGDSGLHIMNDILNVIIARWNAAGSQMTGLIYASQGQVTISGMAGGDQTVFETPGQGYGDLIIQQAEFKESVHWRIKVIGLYSNVSGTLGANVKVKLGSTTIINKSVSSFKNSSNEYMEFDVTLKMENPANCWSVGKCLFGQGDNVSPKEVSMTTSSAVNISTSGPLTLDVDIAPSGGGVGDQFVIISATIEKLNLNLMP